MQENFHILNKIFRIFHSKSHNEKFYAFLDSLIKVFKHSRIFPLFFTLFKSNLKFSTEERRNLDEWNLMELTLLQAIHREFSHRFFLWLMALFMNNLMLNVLYIFLIKDREIQNDGCSSGDVFRKDDKLLKMWGWCSAYHNLSVKKDQNASRNFTQ